MPCYLIGRAGNKSLLSGFTAQGNDWHVGKILLTSAVPNYLETRFAKFNSGPRASHSGLRQFCKPRFQIISSARSVIYNSGPRASHSGLRQFCKPHFQIISSARSVIYDRHITWEPEELQRPRKRIK